MMYVSKKYLIVNLQFLLYRLQRFLHCNRQQQHLFIARKITDNLKIPYYILHRHHFRFPR